MNSRQTTVIAILCMFVVVTRSIEASVQVLAPEDMPDLNLTSLNYDLFDVVNVMEDTKQPPGDNNIDLQDYIRKLFLLIWRLPIVDISTMHRYDSEFEKMISGGPKANWTDCSIKLQHLADRVIQEQTNGRSLVEKSNDYRLFQLLDSFGRPSSSFLRGNVLWLGDYDQCIQTNYVSPAAVSQNNDTEPWPTQPLVTFNTRYCLAHLRWPHWKRTNGFKEWKYTTVKSAICLPESCDSAMAERVRDIIGLLMDVNFGAAYKNFQIEDIYCLPDKQSPLTLWWYNLPSVLCVLFYAIWITLILVATARDMLGHKATTFINIFSFVANTKKLFDVKKKPVPQEQELRGPSQAEKKQPLVQLPTSVTNNNSANNKPNSTDFVSALGQKNRAENGAEAGQDILHQSACDARVDMNYLHCVKVIMLFIVMKSHFFLFTTTAYKIFDLNQSFNRFDVYHLSFAGMAVNIFFMITGTLVAYTLFETFSPFKHARRNKCNPTASLPLVVIGTSDQGNESTDTTTRSETSPDKVQQIDTDNTSTTGISRSVNRECIDNYQHPLLRPTVWIGFSLNRYVRLIPLWAIMTLTVKYLVRYLGEGPLWDYGTSTGTNLHQCREESLALLFLGILNVRPVYHNCIASSWYVMIDLQCAIVVVPIVIIAYLKAPRTMFFVSLALPFVHAIHYLFTDTYLPKDIRGMAKYRAKSLASLSIFLHELIPLYYYTFARATYYIMGITTGYMLHIYRYSNSGKKDNLFICSDTQCSQVNNVQFMCTLIRVMRRPVLSNWFTIAIMFLIMFSVVWVTILLPERYLALTSELALTHVLFALIVLSYALVLPMIIIQLSTGSLGNSDTMKRFLNWSGWLPLSRISLSFLLMDPIMVNLYNYRLKHIVSLDFDMHVAIMIAQSITIYLAALIVYLLLEAPIRSCFNIVLANLLRRSASQIKY